MSPVLGIILLAGSTIAAGAYSVHAWLAARSAERHSLRARLERTSSGAPADTAADILRDDAFSQIPRLNALLHRLSPVAYLDRQLRQAGIAASVAAILYVMGFITLGSALLLQARLGLPRSAAMLIGLVAGGPGTLVCIRWRRNRRLQAFARQLPTAMDMLRSSIRAGHTLNYALEVAVEELTDPIVSEFRTVLTEMRLGLATKTALDHLYRRVPLQELRMFIVAVVLAREVGGSLSEVLNTLAVTLRDRMRLRQQVRALSAQGRTSAALLFIVPPAVAFAANLLRPGFIDPLFTHPTGRLLLGAAIGFQVAGLILVRRVVSPKELRFV